MIEVFTFVGILVGFILGLTGAGGAIIALPLFIHLLKVDLAQATVLSLLAVAIGALLNWPGQRKNTHYRTSFLLFLFSLLGSVVFLPIKTILPELWIKLLFSLVAGLSLFGVWKQKNTLGDQARAIEMRRREFLLKTSLGGFALGGLVTLTGLGGGVMLVPLLNGVLRLSLKDAAATSLFTILLTAISSLGIQYHAIHVDQFGLGVTALVVGSILASVIVRSFAKKMNADSLDSLRRVIVTGVVLLSVVGLYA